VPLQKRCREMPADFSVSGLPDNRAVPVAEDPDADLLCRENVLHANGDGLPWHRLYGAAEVSDAVGGERPGEDRDDPRRERCKGSRGEGNIVWQRENFRAAGQQNVLSALSGLVSEGPAGGYALRGSLHFMPELARPLP